MAPGFATARRAIAAAHRAAPQAGRKALAWQDLAEWPDWAIDDDAARRDALALQVGAAWHAAALRQCIDGRVLQRASRLLGAERLQRLLAASDDHSDTRTAGLLPPPERLETTLRDSGRALLLAAVPRLALRQAVRAHVDPLQQWPADEPLDVARAQSVVAAAQSTFDEARP